MGAAQRASSLVADAEYAALRALQADLDRASQRGYSTFSAKSELASCRDDVASTQEAKAALADVDSLSKRANLAVKTVGSQIEEADRAHRRAAAEYRGANDEYNRASQALDRSVGDHYKQAEMSLAKEATRRFNVAADLGKVAARARSQARTSLTEALAMVRQAQAAADDVHKRVTAAASESAERTRAEEEARRIAEEARRRATIAVSSSHAAVAAIPVADCGKFAPSRLAVLTRRLETAESALAKGQWAPAQREADMVTAEATSLAAQVGAARSDFDRRLTAAQTAVDELTATLGAVDPKLIKEWSDDRDAVEAAREALTRANGHITAERFEEAVSDASASASNLRTATTTAAESQAANERRISIGEAIMDVLEDMNFKVYFADGTKDTPLQITGQVPDEGGRGDFKMAIPLTGDVDFEVTAPEGDGSCSGAVKELRERLAERGVGFTVTDWGYGHEPGNRRQVVDTEVEAETEVEIQTG
ncbi:hypothetical protein [Mycobacterium sp. SMC-4]|uniref:hypothetical protein n=1 Tax=Mycobacterium sp. SMC-4 TaxID=2857059 RepID=UPI0021B25DC5|nr:hypothetical protein [Mycobacterium sp. SMC-4]UXA17453.1 hypothetical protein KXD98_22440 [Mycobacterium sp. SMC-4]